MHNMIKTLISKNDSKNVIEKNVEAIVVNQSNSKSITTFVLTRKNFNDVTIEDRNEFLYITN